MRGIDRRAGAIELLRDLVDARRRLFAKGERGKDQRDKQKEAEQHGSAQGDVISGSDAKRLQQQ
jgi:hypothetical protein